MACPTPRSATPLIIAGQTTKTHVSRILARLGSRDRVQAVVPADETGLVTPGESSTARTNPGTTPDQQRRPSGGPAIGPRRAESPDRHRPTPDRNPASART